MPIIRLPGGLIVELESVSEAAEFVRAMQAPPPKVESTSSADGSDFETEPSEPEQRELGDWTPGAARELARRLPESASRVFEVLVSGGSTWADGGQLATITNVELKGLGVVVSAITRAAHQLGMPDPIEKERERVGTSRTTRLRLTRDFRLAWGSPSQGGLTAS